MKKLLAIAISAAALSAMADATTAEGSNEIGTLAIQSSLRKTIVAVPFNTLGEATTSIKPSDLILTTGLLDGDQLYIFKNGAYEGWLLDGSAWTAVDNAVAGLPDRSKADGETTVPLGSGFWLVRNSSYVEGTPFTFYIYGQYVSGVTSDIVAGAQNLIANPLTEPARPNIAKPSAGDVILVPQQGPAPQRYTYRNNAWKQSGSTVTLPQFAPGTGAWYISAGSSNTTCSWE